MEEAEYQNGLLFIVPVLMDKPLGGNPLQGSSFEANSRHFWDLGISFAEAGASGTLPYLLPYLTSPSNASVGTVAFLQLYRSHTFLIWEVRSLKIKERSPGTTFSVVRPRSRVKRISRSQEYQLWYALTITPRRPHTVGHNFGIFGNKKSFWRISLLHGIPRMRCCETLFGGPKSFIHCFP